MGGNSLRLKNRTYHLSLLGLLSLFNLLSLLSLVSLLGLLGLFCRLLGLGLGLLDSFLDL